MFLVVPEFAFIFAVVLVIDQNAPSVPFPLEELTVVNDPFFVFVKLAFSMEQIVFEVTLVC